MTAMFLGLDIGSKRTGLALAVNNMAVEYATLSMADDLGQQLKSIIEKEGITELVVGFPLYEDGRVSPQADFVQQTVEQLKPLINLPVHFEDEVLTTVEAKRLLELSGVDSSEVQERIDQMAACLILQQYLDRRREVGKER